MTDAATQRADPLSPARQKLLQRLNAGGARKVCYPLGYSQRGMWFIDQLEPGTALYNMPFGSRYLGPLDERALWRSLRELVQRHEALRTIFPARNGVAVQEVLPDIGEIEVTEDLSALPGVEREAALSQRIHAHTHTPFDLARGPLLRFVLFRLGAEDHVLYANMHHINGDGWSVYVLQQELDTLYRAYADGASDSPLPTRPLQYGDYAIWQRGWMASLAMQEELDFWKRELRGAEQATLPTDLPRPDILVHRGRSLGAIYPAALCARFAALCLQEKLTPFMALLGLFEVAVARYLGVDDFLVGTPIANRTRVDTEGIVGCFINTLALRSDVRAEAAGGDPSLRALLARVRERTLRAYEHQNLPFSKLVEELVPIQVLSRTPLFQAMFSLENYPSSKPLPGLEQKDVDICVELTKLELTLTMAEQDGVYRSHLEYDANLFTAPRMQRLMTCFHAMLEGLVDNPARAAFDDAWLPAEERASLLAWGTGEGACWDDALVPDLLARAAAAHGEALAVRAEDGGATHAALGLRAARIARALAAHGVGPDVAVGVMMERGTDLVATVVGALRSGAVYVPLDPAYPADRLSFMAADAGLRVLVVDAATRALAPQGAWLVVELEGGRRHDGAVDSTPMAAGAVLHPEHLAYVIYTSGSTGRPKGVGVTQRGLANQLQWVTRAFGLAPEDRFLQKTSISFDSSLEELLAPLLVGACLVPARPRAEHDAEYLAALVASERMTCVDLAPSLLEALLPLIDDKAWSSVRRVICGGEALRADVARSLREKLPHITLVNAYGPTETAIQSAWAEMRGPLAARCAADPAGTTVESASEGVPIGRPVANTTLRVLDARGALVPVGTRGELFIGGAGVARGYLGQARLTAERFVPDSFGPPGARMYRTGDQVRWSEDAQLEFLGRVDHQVKLRGYRIELDEIERVLETHEGVRQAITLLREDVPGQPRLVAYVLPAAAAPQVEAMRLHAAKSLPAYMVPVAFVVSEAWPLLPNGKVDRRTLPAPDEAAFALRPYVAPRGEVEELVASVFEDVLKRERVGRHDNFFELGGHSLLAVQFISRIRRALEREFRLMDLFTHPTVEGVAHLLAEAAASDFPPLQPAPRDLPLPLSFAQARLWFLDRIEGVEGVDLAYLVPFGMRLRGVLDEGALRGALDALAERHEVLRTSFAEMGGEGVQHIAPARRGAFPLALDDRRDAPDRALVLREAVTREMRTPFDLATGPLARARLVRLDVDDHGLVIVMHHAITDGWSINLLLGEFAALYRAFHAGRPSPLPPLAVQYGDYAAWQRGWLVGDRLTQERNWWRTALADAPSQINLPTDRPRPAVQDFRGRGLGFEVDAATTRGLRLLAQSQGATPYMVVLGAWALLLGRLSGQGEVVVGTPTANRPLRELEDLVGFFVNMLPLRLALNGEPTVAQWVDRVRETFLAAHQHQLLGFEQIVEAVNPPRSASHSPLFQVMFTWETAGTDAAGPGLPGLDTEGLEMVGSGMAKYELTLAMEDAGERLGGHVEFQSALFDDPSIQCLIDCFRHLLTALAADSTRKIDDVPLLPPEQRHRVLHAWNDASLQLQPFEFTQLAIAAQAARTPRALAVADGLRSMAYAELDARANRLAHHLQLLGVRLEDRVGLCAMRGVDMVVGQLAVLKAGAAYVPLDPDYPVERLRAMLEDATPRLVLASNALLARLDGVLGVQRVVDLDDDEAWPTDTQAPPIKGLRPDSLAYVIYTSGSTGRPKGVMLQHDQLANFLAWAREAFAAELLAHTLAATSLSFDLHVFETLLPLTVGGTVELVDNVLALQDFRRPVTLVNTVPSAMEALLDAGVLPGTVRCVNLAGEALRPGLVERVFASSRAQAVCNLYGPTETTTYSTWTRVQRGQPFTGHVGKPIANTRIYLLDPQGQPVPVGVVGELYIGGAGVARGYLGDPGLTAGRFVADPFVAPGGPGSRMYRTGDLARWRANGDIEYLGRADHQVKLRGFRIELGEIERELEDVDGVQQAIVQLREDTPGARQLVAYVVGAAPGTSPAPDALRAALARRLPGFMLPSAFVPLTALPLTPNGKLDRRQLPAPQTAAGAVAGYEAPQGPVEQPLAAIFSEVLGVPKVGRQDDFFGLGGHSLLAVRLMRRIELEMGARLPLRTVFEAPSVATLAMVIVREMGDVSPATNERHALVKLADGPVEQAPLFLVHPIGGHVFCYMELARALGGALPVHALEARVEDDPRADVLALARCYLQQVRAHQPGGPYRLGGWSFGGLVAWEMAAQLRAAGEEVALLVLIDTHAPAAEEGLSDEQRHAQALALLHHELGQGDTDARRLDDEAFDALDVAGRLRELEDELVRHGLADTARAAAEAARLLAVYERHLAAMASYPLLPAPQPLLLFAAADSGDAAGLAQSWQRASGRRADVLELPGTHYSLLQGELVTRIAQRLLQAVRVLRKPTSAAH